MKYYIILLVAVCTLFSCNSSITEEHTVEIGTLEVVTEMKLSPGNVAVSQEGRMFATIHPLRKGDLQLIEITDKNTQIPFPNQEMQSSVKASSDDKFDSPLGLVFDTKNRLWTVDVGLELGKTRVFAYDIDTKEELYRFDIPKELTPKTSFVQDLAIDDKNGFVYLADAMDPGIIVIDIKNATYRRIVDLPSMESEDIDIVIDGEIQHFLGNPMRISIDPITLSKDKETLYYGAMNSNSWYSLPTNSIRNGATDNEIFKSISRVGKKPICDGAATDDEGNHYFTNLQNYSIDVLSKDGKLSTLKKHPHLNWPDNIRIHGDWLYIASNQTHKSPAFKGEELAEAPYRILKLKYK